MQVVIPNEIGFSLLKGAKPGTTVEERVVEVLTSHVEYMEKLDESSTDPEVGKETV